MKTLCFLFLFASSALTLSFTGVPAAQAADLPDGPNKDLVATKCSGCHDLSVVISKRLSANEWRTKVKIMTAQGAEVSLQEMDQIVDYLSTRFGVTPPTTK